MKSEKCNKCKVPISLVDCAYNEGLCKECYYNQEYIKSELNNKYINLIKGEMNGGINAPITTTEIKQKLE